VGCPVPRGRWLRIATEDRESGAEIYLFDAVGVLVHSARFDGGVPVAAIAGYIDSVARVPR
jgi:hypothetical protein